MMKVFLTVLICLLLSTSACAELVLVNPTNEGNIQITASELPAEIEVTIKNAGLRAVLNIVPETDLNAEIVPTGFGLDPGKERTFLVRVWETEDITGIITVENQSFEAKIIIVNNSLIGNAIDIWTEHQQTLVFIWMGFLTLLIIGIIIKST